MSPCRHLHLTGISVPSHPSPALVTCRYPLFGLLFLCFASAILGDSAAEALLLAHFDASVIPRMYLVNAVFLFLASTFLIPLIDRVDRGAFFLLFILGHGGLLLLTWVAVTFGMAFLFVPLFSYAYVTKIFLFLLFWTLANDLVDSRQAGSQFPFIAAGGTVGAIGISFSIPWILRVVDARNLLLVWAGLTLCLAAGFVPLRRSLGRYFRASSDKQKHTKRDLGATLKDMGIVCREPLLSTMAVLYFMLFFVLLNQHYAFYEVVKMRYGEAAAIASFLGYFNGVSMGATLFLQVTVAGVILRKMGSTRAMFFLPAVLCLVFGVQSYMAFAAGGAPVGAAALFWVVVAGVGLRIAFFDSFFSPNFQVFFSSLPHEVRGRAKVSIEGLVKPLAMVAASVWLLWVSSQLPWSVNMLLLLLLSAAMVVQTFRIRRRYTESLTRYLSGMDVRAAALLGGSIGAEGSERFLAEMRRRLEDERDEIRHYIVELLARLDTDDSVAVLRDHLERGDGRTRAVIVSALAPLRRDDLRSTFSALLGDPDDRVVANTVEALAAYGDAETAEGLTAFINHRHHRVRVNAIVALWKCRSRIMKSMLLERLRRMLASDEPGEVASALYALGEMGEWSDALHELRLFFRDRVALLDGDRRVWRRYTLALGKNPCEWSLDTLLALASRTGRTQRESLAAAVRCALEHGCSIGRMTERLVETDFMVREVVLRGMLGADREQVDEVAAKRLIEIAKEEAEGVRMAREGRGLATARDTSAGELLAYAIDEECVERRMNNLVYVCALLDRTGQIGRVVRRLSHEDRHVRARAVEVLDNVGNSRVNRLLVGLLDVDGSVGAPARSDAHGRALDRFWTLIDGLRRCPNEWVRLCAAYCWDAELRAAP